MAENYTSLITAFRFWRASIPVGLILGSAISLSGLLWWPGLISPSTAFTPALIAIVGKLSPAAIWLIVLVAVFLLGSAWTALSYSLLLVASSSCLRRLPLASSTKDWNWWQRVRLPVRVDDLRRLQERMGSVPQYRDLEECDRDNAFRLCLRSVIRNTPAALDVDIAGGGSAVRAVSNARLTAGLVIPIPWMLLAISAHLLEAFSGLRVAFACLACVLFFGLAVASFRELKVSIGSMTRTGLTQEALGDHARLAVDSSRTDEEIDQADQRLQ